MISKELLSEVLGEHIQQLTNDCNIIRLKLGGMDKNTHIAYQVNLKWYFINIHELAHKVKEWAYNKGYSLSSGLVLKDADADWKAYCTYESYEDDDSCSECGLIEYPFMKADTEPEAIFKAGEYILKELENGKS